MDPDDDFDTHLRASELDAAMRSTNIAISVVVALSSIAFVGRFGYAFVGFASITLGFWIVRLVLPERLLSVAAWGRILFYASSVSLVGGSITSGGMSSPVIYFAGLVAVVRYVLIPDADRRLAVQGVFMVAIVFLVDVSTGAAIDWFEVAVAFVLAASSPVVGDCVALVGDEHRRRASVDHLTRCLNRHALDARADELEEQSRFTDGTLCVVMFDLDHFKEINDVHGHGVGDVVLSRTAAIARRQLRRFELLYRIGGEEFAILMPGADEAVAAATAEQIRSAIAHGPIEGVELTASFGVAEQASPFDVRAAMDEADRRLYTAKRLGRDRVVCSLQADVGS